MLADRERNRRIYLQTRKYIELVMLAERGIDPSILESYLIPSHQLRELTLQGIYENLLLHAKNKGNGGTAIERVFGDGWDTTYGKKYQRWAYLKQLLSDFNPHIAAQNWDIYGLFLLLRDEPFSVDEPSMPVYGFCRTIIGGANYLKKFKDADEFYNHFDEIDAKQALYELQAVPGYGEALPYDFLKELGYVQYVKPDVHTMKICSGLGLVASEDDPQETVYALQKIAADANETPYSIDRMFWLIGSGWFFNLRSEDRKAFEIWGGKRNADQRRQAFVQWLQSEI